MAKTQELIKKSNKNITVWLDSISRGFSPNGKRVNVKMVEDGEIVDIAYSGGQNFGSGGYRLRSRYSGEEPEFIEYLPGERDSFTSTSFASFKMKSPSIISISSSDDIGGGRDFGTTVYVCASEDQIRAAVEAVRNELKENSAHADPKLLKDYLLLCWRKKAEWGTEWKGHFHPKWILWALEVGPGTSEEDHIRKLLRYKKDILVSFYHILYHMKKDERISFFEKARTEYDSEVKTSKVDFAKKQAKILQQMGLTTKTAWKIIRTVGPSNAVQTYNWIISIQKSHPRAFLYTHLSQIAKRAKGIYSWGLLNKQFEKHNIETPPGSYQQIFKHLRLAQELGFIHQDLQIHRPN